MEKDRQKVDPPRPGLNRDELSPATEEAKTLGRRRGLLAWVVVLGLIMLTFHLYMSRQQRYEDMRYSPEFVELVQAGTIRECEIVEESSGVTYIRGKYQSDGETAPHRFKVQIRRGMTGLGELLEANGVKYKVVHASDYVVQLLTNLLPVVLIFGILYFLFVRQMRQAGHGALNFGKSRAKLLNRESSKTTFSNVAGIDEAREEVQEIIDFLKDPKKFQKLGGRIPKGVMLMGPPGTGKTLLAKAIAGEADVPFFSISGSDFVEMFVGVGASRVRDMFEQGKKNAPCILFIDEIDAVGRSRFSGIGGGHDEREQTLNALLVEMDGFDTSEGVIVVAATNRPDVLDQALLRPGRFDRQIMIDLPTIDGREAILKIHAESVRLADVTDLRRVARGTPGFSGADLENLLNEAALLAARNGKEAVEMSDLEEARDKVKWGRERRSRKLDDQEKRLTAYHEAGHALVQATIEGAQPLHKVTIIPRGMFLGATMSLPDKDRYTRGRKEFEGELTIFMGGRAAEELFCEDITSGASSDLKQATRIARLMVCSWGMSKSLGPQTFGDNEELLFLGREVARTQTYSEETARRIDQEVSDLLVQSHKRAHEIIATHRDKLETMASLLLECETLDGCDVDEIIKHGRVLSAEERKAIDRQAQPDEPDQSERPEETTQELDAATSA